MFKDNLYEVVKGAVSQELCTHLDLEFELVKKNKITEKQGIKNITSMITKLRQAIINSGH